MSTQRRYVSVTDTAKLLRAALRSEFPGVKFSVRSSKYAGGASIDVSWTDGPTASAVDDIAKLYQGATFDGMTDSKDYHDALLAGPDGEVETVHFGADWVHTQRRLSPEFLAAGAAFIAAQHHRGRIRADYPERCAGCGNTMMAGTDCYATRARWGREFTCSPECGARREAMFGFIRPGRAAVKA